MHIPKQNKKTILKYVFKEGVCVAKKDFQLPKHPEIRDVTNLQVCLKTHAFPIFKLDDDKIDYGHSMTYQPSKKCW